MSYFPPYIDATGIHIPSYSDILDKLVADYKRIMGTDENGEDIYLGEDTQDYQQISVLALAFNDAMEELVECYNVRNPNYAYGASLDYLLPINGITRKVPSYSQVTLAVTGKPNAVMHENLQAKDTADYIWRIPLAFTIGSDGKTQVTAKCTTAGYIQADAGAICLINTPVADWYSVTNPLPATPGQALESDAKAKARRAISISMPTRSIKDGIIAGLSNLDGVTRLKVIENSGDIASSDGIPAHSISAVVEGGTDAAVARTLLLKKGPGPGTYGTTSITVQDSYGEDNIINFFRPVVVTIYPTITIKALAGWDSSMEAEIKAALAGYAETIDIGGIYNVSYLWSLAFSVLTAGTAAFAVQSLVAKKGSAGSTVADTIQLGFNEAATCEAANVTVTIV